LGLFYRRRSYEPWFLFEIGHLQVAWVMTQMQQGGKRRRTTQQKNSRPERHTSMTSFSPARNRVLRRIPPLFMALATAVIAVGCGGPKGTVTGVVKYQGKIVKGGTVTFVCASGKPGGSSPIAEDGTYTIKDVPVGDVQITVETESAKPSAQAQAHPYKAPQGAPPEASNFTQGDKPKDRYVQIPESYGNPGTSGLTYTVAEGSQEHPIDLKK
jgi:hypothetical protein